MGSEMCIRDSNYAILIISEDPDGIYGNLSRHIRDRYRPSNNDNNAAAAAAAAIVTFPEFITYILVEHGEEEVDETAAAANPTVNRYWTSYWHACAPCHHLTRPTTIAKFGSSSFNAEIDYIFQV